MAVIVWDGSTVTLYWNGDVEYTDDQAGAPFTSRLITLGAMNTDSGALSPSACDLYKALAIDRALTPEEVVNLTDYWSA